MAQPSPWSSKLLDHHSLTISKTLCLQISGSLTKGNAPLAKLSAPLIKLSAPLIKLSAPLTILSAPLMNLSGSTVTMEFQTSGSSLTHHKQDSVLTNQWLTYKRKCPTCKIECPTCKIECPAHKIECPTHNIECPTHEFESLNLHHGVPNLRIIIDSPRARLCAYKSVAHLQKEMPHL